MQQNDILQMYRLKSTVLVKQGENGVTLGSTVSFPGRANRKTLWLMGDRNVTLTIDGVPLAPSLGTQGQNMPFILDRAVFGDWIARGGTVQLNAAQTYFIMGETWLEEAPLQP